MARTKQNKKSAARVIKKAAGENVDEILEVGEGVEPVALQVVDDSEGVLPLEDWHEHVEGDREDVLEDVEVGGHETEAVAREKKETPSINGFTVGTRKGIGIKTYRVPGTTVALPVRAIIAPLLIGFAREFHQKVERLRKGWCWGYAARSIRGSKRPSFHWAGIAIDLNAPKHPLGRAGTFNAAQRKTINELIKKYGLRWGGNYRRRKDDMHFEVILPRAEAVALAKRIQKGGAK